MRYVICKNNELDELHRYGINAFTWSMKILCNIFSEEDIAKYRKIVKHEYQDLSLEDLEIMPEEMMKELLHYIENVDILVTEYGYSYIRFPYEDFFNPSPIGGNLNLKDCVNEKHPVQKTLFKR